MEVTYLTAINQALHEEMRRDENVFVMGEDVADLGGAFNELKSLEFAAEQQQKRVDEIEARRAQSRLDEMAIVRHLRKHARQAP